MATQDSIIKLTGSLGDLSFYKTKNGYAARTKGGISADRIKNDPAFIRTRENGAEFARGGKAAKVMRLAFRSQLLSLADKRITSRLVKELMRVIQSDSTNPRGERNVIDGEVALLNGFEFNENATLKQTFLAPFSSEIVRATGALTVNIESFIPNEMIVPPAGATHFNLMLVGAAIDFATETYVTESMESSPNVLDNQVVSEQSLSLNLPANNTHPIFLALGIKFSQIVNGVHYSLKNGAHNGLAIVGVGPHP